MRIRGGYHHVGSLSLLAVALVVLPLAFLACDNDGDPETIFVEKPLFEDPPSEALGFLGYDEEADKLTVCGNCHVGQQSAWQQTGHAHAWETLQATGHAQASCENCHTVGPNGNVMEAGGWASVQEERYHDVQCENCHGPGQTHVENPDASQPIPSVDLGDLSDLSDLSNAKSCAQCHQGTHHGFVNEWAASPHAQVVASAAGREECAGCHRGQTAIQRFGDNSDYVEKNSAEPLPVTCVVCHDPHDATYEHQLRLPVNTTSIEEHLCAQCHNRRTVPDPNSSHGLEPHAPEAALLIGDAGWFPPNANIDQGQIRGTHGSDRNPELCATCHLSSFTVTDPVSGGHVFSVTGHSFRPAPCLDDQGVPLPFEENCPLTAEDRSFVSCTASGCHGDEQAAFSALLAATTRIQSRADELHALLEEVDPNLEEAGGAIDPGDPTFTVAEGALFNYHLATFGNADFGTNTVVGASAHNPFLIEALLIASLQAVQDTYGVTMSPSVNWEVELQKVLDRVPQ